MSALLWFLLPVAYLMGYLTRAGMLNDENRRLLEANQRLVAMAGDYPKLREDYKNLRAVCSQQYAALIVARSALVASKQASTNVNKLRELHGRN